MPEAGGRIPSARTVETMSSNGRFTFAPADALNSRDRNSSRSTGRIAVFVLQVDLRQPVHQRRRRVVADEPDGELAGDALARWRGWRAR